MLLFPQRLKGLCKKRFPRMGLALVAAALWAAVLPSAGSGCSRVNRAPEKEAVEEETIPEPEKPPLTVTYLGQSAFLLESGEKIFLMDPFDPGFGLGRIAVEADLVTISHDHLDHNYAAGGGREARVIRGLTPQGDWSGAVLEESGLYLYTIPAYHDRNGGVWLGKNSIFVLEIAGLRLVHLGDLGHFLDEREKGLLGKADLLVVPVGGYYTLPAAEALQLIEDLAPGVAVPVHYRTGENPDPSLGSLEEFLDLLSTLPVRYPNGPVTLTPDSFPETTEIWVLQPLPPGGI